MKEEGGRELSMSGNSDLYERDFCEWTQTTADLVRARLPEWIAQAYPRAVVEAVDEMRLLKNPFPPECPFTAEQILDDDFFPERR